MTTSNRAAPATLELRAFRGMRFDPEVVGDIGAVTSPPYDVMDRPMVESLVNGHPRNIVRLILPRMVSDPVTDADPYARAAALLDRWRAHGTLVTDPSPALYVYEYGDATHSVCGVVGALALRDPADRVVLPHEDVIPGIVEDRLQMMEAAHANLEPILLVYDGAAGAAAVIDAARSQPPLTDVDAPDGTFHRLWRVDDPDEIDAIERSLAPHQALIADGHHRYATYRRLQARHQGAAGPWDHGLALLIDQSRCPLQLGAIHRSVSELPLATLEAPPGFSLSDLADLDLLAPAPPRRRELVLSDGVAMRRLRWTGEAAEAFSDAQLLHERVLSAWDVHDDQVGYHHTVAQALRNAHQDGGIAVLLHPTTVDEVMAAARAGKVMPRKTTSFGPKPRTGLVMRSFRDVL